MSRNGTQTRTSPRCSVQFVRSWSEQMSALFGLFAGKRPTGADARPPIKMGTFLGLREWKKVTYPSRQACRPPGAHACHDACNEKWAMCELRSNETAADASFTFWSSPLHFAMYSATKASNSSHVVQFFFCS